MLKQVLNQSSNSIGHQSQAKNMRCAVEMSSVKCGIVVLFASKCDLIGFCVLYQCAQKNMNVIYSFILFNNQQQQHRCELITQSLRSFSR